MLYIFHIKKKGHPSLYHIILCIKQIYTVPHSGTFSCYIAPSHWRSKR